jgi:hypothetical protein
MKSIFAFFFIVLILSNLSFAQSVPNKPFTKFVVYQDKNTPNHFVPSGYMPTGECIKMDDVWSKECHDGKTCIKVTYDVACSQKSRKWAGVYWLHPADNWGDRTKWSRYPV